MQKKNSTPSPAELREKRQSRFIFTAVANILYIIPCLSCMAMAILLEGFTPSFIAALAVMLLNLPVCLIVISRYNKKSGRKAVIALAAVMLALHVICCPLVGVWYIVMAPSFVLYCLMIAWSDVVGNH